MLLLQLYFITLLFLIKMLMLLWPIFFFFFITQSVLIAAYKTELRGKKWMRLTHFRIVSEMFFQQS